MYSTPKIVVNIGKPNNNVPLARFMYSKVPANGEKSDENQAHWNPKSCMMRGEVKDGRESFEVREGQMCVSLTAVEVSCL